MKPPKYIDNAKVLLWDFSEDKPFGFIKNADGTIASKIYGFAICQYDGSGKIYRFSCNKNWEVEHDADYDSIKSAIDNLPEQYRNIAVNWKSYI